MLDEIRPNPQHLIKNRSRHSSEAMPAHFFLADAHSAHRSKDCVFAHRPPAGARPRKNKLSLAGKRLKLSQDLNSLAAEGNDVRDLGLCHGVAPFRGT